MISTKAKGLDISFSASPTSSISAQPLESKITYYLLYSSHPLEKTLEMVPDLDDLSRVEVLCHCIDMYGNQDDATSFGPCKAILYHELAKVSISNIVRFS